MDFKVFGQLETLFYGSFVSMMTSFPTIWSESTHYTLVEKFCSLKEQQKFASYNTKWFTIYCLNLLAATAHYIYRCPHVLHGYKCTIRV